MVRTLLFTCRFCGAKKTVTIEGEDAFKVEAALWFRKHKPCAAGKEIRFDVSGQKDEGSVPEPIASFVLKD